MIALALLGAAVACAPHSGKVVVHNSDDEVAASERIERPRTATRIAIRGSEPTTATIERIGSQSRKYAENKGFVAWEQ
jgi:hypothetical protein